MQGLIQTFFSVIQKLEIEKVPYMVVGSMASMIYGEPRMTHDLDLVVELLPTDAQKIESWFPIEEFYCPPPEVLQAEIVHRGQFNLIHHESGLKIDLMVRKEGAHAVAEFARRRRAPFGEGREVYLATPEDVIVKKLEFFRQGGSVKHLKDIRGILAETPLDQEYLQGWIDRLGLGVEWSQIQAPFPLF